MTFAFQQVSYLKAAVGEVWASVSTMRGVNRELMPLVRMTYPRTADQIVDVPVGKPAFRSVLLLAGFIPFDLHHLQLVTFEPGKGFHERSSSLMQRVWVHRRTLSAQGGGCKVVDEVEFAPRLPLVGYLMLPIFRLVFRWRHRNLRRMFGNTNEF